MPILPEITADYIVSKWRNEQIIVSAPIAEIMDFLVAEIERLRLDAKRLDFVLRWAEDLSCKVPGGLFYVASRDQIDEIIRIHPRYAAMAQDQPAAEQEQADGS